MDRAARRLSFWLVAALLVGVAGVACWVPFAGMLRAWRDIPASQRPAFTHPVGRRALP